MGAGQIVRGVLGTHVVISAILFGGQPGRRVPLWQTG